MDEYMYTLSKDFRRSIGFDWIKNEIGETVSFSQIRFGRTRQFK